MEISIPTIQEQPLPFYQVIDERDFLAGAVGTRTIQPQAINANHLVQDQPILKSSAQIGEAVVVAQGIADGAVSATKIGNLAVQNIHIGNGVVDNLKIANGAIYNVHITNGAIANANIQDGAVTNLKVANGSIDNAKIVNGAIDNAKIVDGAITNAKIGYGVVDNAKIALASIDNARIQDGAITNAKISSLSADKINVGTLSGISIVGNTIRTSNGATRLEMNHAYQTFWAVNNNVVRMELSAGGLAFWNEYGALAGNIVGRYINGASQVDIGDGGGLNVSGGINVGNSGIDTSGAMYASQGYYMPTSARLYAGGNLIGYKSDFGSAGLNPDGHFANSSVQFSFKFQGIVNNVGEVFYCDTAGNYVKTSDLRWKTDIEEIENGLSVVMKLKPKTYRYKHAPEDKQSGFVAQDILADIPEIRHIVKGNESKYSLSDTEIIPYLVKAIQELSIKVNSK